MSGLIQTYCDAVQFRSELQPAEWARKHVQLFRSTDAKNYRPEFTPWFSEPMIEIRDNRNREICITTPVGSGKSTMIEAIGCNILTEDPGPMLITGQTDDDISDWAETGFWPTLKACEPLKHRLPTERGKMRKMAGMIDRSPIHLTGANMSGLQSKSERWCLGDEAWMWKKSLAAEFRKRIHRRWNGRIVLMGQAGWLETGDDSEMVGDDFTVAHDQGEQREWCFACPQCGDVQPYKLAQMKFPEEGSPAVRAQQAVYECVNCTTAWEDSSKTRRAFALASRYERMREAQLPGHISFHLNVLALWRSPWADAIAEFLQATEAMKQGNSLPLQQFTQKQLAEPWQEDMSISRPDLDLIEEDGSEFANGEKIDDESIRFLEIDTQRDHYWALIRAFRGDGSSVVLTYRRISTEETIERLREKMGILPHHTYIDSGFDSGRVYDICARFGWIAIKGDNVKSYRHPVKGGGHIERLVSTRRTVAAPCGVRVPLIHLAVNPIKDMLARLRSGKGVRWQAVSDIGKDYIKQLDSEERQDKLKAGTKQVEEIWVRKRRDNHAWDCEVYAIGSALIWRVFAD